MGTMSMIPSERFASINQDWQADWLGAEGPVLLPLADTQITSQNSVQYSNDTARRLAQLNGAMLTTVRSWLQEDFGLETVQYPDQGDRLWELVSGVGLEVLGRRLVLVPIDAALMGDEWEGMAIPQEWVDVAALAGDLYVPVSVDLEQQVLQVWGFITHAAVRAAIQPSPGQAGLTSGQSSGRWDDLYREYWLDRSALVPDLEVLVVALQQRVLAERQPIAELPRLGAATLERLLGQLSQPSAFLPRLSVPFAQWGALLEGGDWRSLYELRLKAVARETVCQALGVELGMNLGVDLGVDLGAWLQASFTEAVAAGWQAVESFLSPQQAAFAVRSYDGPTVRRAKLLNLQVQFGVESLILLVALTPEPDGRTGVLVQLHPQGEVPYLPGDLCLQLLSMEGEELQSLTTRDRDIYIQLPYFRCHPGTTFQVQVASQVARVRELFSIPE
jgi:hypothetical protein